MAVYVDKDTNPYRRMITCRMIADSLEELHKMADAIGINRKWCQPKNSPHYDICTSKRKLAIMFGAKEVGHKKMGMLIKYYRRFNNG